MKKLVLLFALVIAITMISCKQQAVDSNSNTTDSVKTDSTTVKVDSISIKK